MTADNYKSSLKQAKQDLAHAVEELGETQAKTEELETQIADLRQVVAVLSKLCGEEMVEIEDALGLTDSIRKVMRASVEGLTAQGVRLRLEADGFNTRRYGNLLASIHTVLKRLLEKGQVSLAGETGDGKPVYKWRMTLGQRLSLTPLTKQIEAERQAAPVQKLGENKLSGKKD